MVSVTDTRGKAPGRTPVASHGPENNITLPASFAAARYDGKDVALAWHGIENLELGTWQAWAHTKLAAAVKKNE